MKKLYYVKWHTDRHLITYWVCLASSTSERDMKFEKFLKENNLQLGAYSPRELEIPENGIILPIN